MLHVRRAFPVVCALSLFPATASFAQTPIAEARDLAVGTSVTVNGIVTSGNELGSVRYVQDGTAGIAVYPGTGSVIGFSPARGSDLTVTGTLTLYNGLLEIDPVTAFTVNSAGNALPAAQLITASQLDESRESELVRINGCVFADAGGTFTSGSWDFTSNGQSAIIYLKSGHPLIGSGIPAGSVDIVGITSQYSTDQPPVGGYQLLPRGAADLIASSTISLSGAVQQSNILPDGFTLDWPTNLGGDSHVSFGTTPTLGAQTAVAGNTLAHSVPLTGLQPATFYYAQCWSVLGTDTARSTIGLYSTASSVPGSITVYFNQTVDNSVATGALAIDLGGAIDDTLSAYIDRAQSTIAYAVYNTTTNSIVTALNDAYDRGVQVRVIAEGSNSNTALANLIAAIPRLYRTDGLGSGMHDKFLAIDADVPDAAHLITGSTNSTNQGFFEDANNLVIVRDQALTRAYREEFNEMWGSSGATPNVGNSRFGADKTDNTPHLFNVNGSLIESSFSPSDGTTARIAHAIHTADEHIEFALFAFTSSLLADALIDEQAQGRPVRGVLDTDQLDAWLMQYLVDGNIDVHTDGDVDGLLHHKYAIVDRDVPGGDPLVITGSHNWSYTAETINDENILIIHNAEVANLYYQEWNARWGLAVGARELTNDPGTLIVAPNPVNDVLHLLMNVASGEPTTLMVLDAAGRTVIAERSSTKRQLDTSALAEGSYTLVLRTDARTTCAHFIIAR
ncbi:MAG: phospholipase D-like domain-containing protein [Flavobacteriales bacterium]